tara:strand:+ start:1589 stop:2677 length:1089 start_codon:yes stop_codon:yes gene_type:complete
MSSFSIAALELLIGIGLLFVGGEIFVQGSIALALILGVPQLVIGLTVVALGTSAPELFVSVNSVINGSDALAVSNVVGSNIFNVMVVLGLSAIIIPLKVESRLVRRDVPLLIAVSTAVWGMGSSGRFTWQAGVSLIVALIINTIWEIKTVREEPEGIADAEPKIDLLYDKNVKYKSFIKVFAGILLLTFGSKLLIGGATTAANLLGVSESIIGLTIVSAGTSLPELTTSIVATFKGKTDLAIGNVVGSSLLNMLLVLGSSAIASGIYGLQVDSLLINRDLPLMVITTLACMPIFWTKGRISRVEGSMLFGLYIFYLIDQVIPKTYPTWQNEFRTIMICIIIPLFIIIISFQTIRYWIAVKKI